MVNLVFYDFRQNTKNKQKENGKIKIYQKIKQIISLNKFYLELI